MSAARKITARPSKSAKARRRAGCPSPLCRPPTWSRRSSELSEFEYGLIVAGNAFNRWVVRCMAAAGLKELPRWRCYCCTT